MTQLDGGHGARHVRLADLPQAEIGDHIWHPVRRALGATGFGVGAYSADRAGDVLVGAHDETGLGSNRHEELYVVLAGRALFELDGQELELGPEEFLLVEPQTRRGARAARRRHERARDRRRSRGGGAGAVRALVRGAHRGHPRRSRRDRRRRPGRPPRPRPAELPARLLPGARGRARRRRAAPAAGGCLGRPRMGVARGRRRPRRAALGARRAADPQRPSGRSTRSRRAPARTSSSSTPASRTPACGTRSGSTGRPGSA